MSSPRIPNFERALAELRQHGSVSGPQLCALTGITYRNVDYWDRMNILKPSGMSAAGSGSQRRYLVADVRCASVLKALIDAGMGVSDAARVLPFVRDNEGCRWAFVGRNAGVCAEGELERSVAEDGAAVIVDLAAFAGEPRRRAEVEEVARDVAS